MKDLSTVQSKPPLEKDAELPISLSHTISTSPTYKELCASWNDRDPFVRMELLENLIQNKILSDYECNTLTAELSLLEKAQIANFIGRCVEAPTYSQTFHSCWTALQREDRQFFVRKFTFEQPENALMVAPFVDLFNRMVEFDAEKPSFRFSQSIRQVGPNNESVLPESFPIFPALFDTLDRAAPLLKAVVEHSSVPRLHAYVEAFEKTSSSLLIEHLPNLIERGILTDVKAQKILFSVQASFHFTHQLFDKLSERQALAHNADETHIKRGLRESISVLKSFDQVKSILGKERAQMEYLEKLWGRGLPIAHLAEGIGLRPNQLRRIIFAAEAGGMSKLSLAQFADLPALIALGENRVALKLLTNIVRDRDHNLCAYLEHHLPNVLLWLEPNDRKALVNQILRHVPNICFLRFGELQSLNLMNAEQLIRSCCSSYDSLIVTAPLLRHHFLESESSTLEGSRRHYLCKSLIMKELQRSPELALNNTISKLVFSPAERIEFLTTQLRNGGTASLISEILHKSSELSKSNVNPFSSGLILEIPTELIRSELKLDQALFMQIATSGLWDQLLLLFSKEEREAHFLKGLDSKNITAVFESYEVSSYLTNAPQLLTDVLDRASDLGALDTFRLLAIHFPFVGEFSNSFNRMSKATRDNSKLFRERLLEVVRDHPEMACTRAVWSALGTESAQHFIKISAQSLVSQNPLELISLAQNRVLDLTQLGELEQRHRYALAFLEDTEQLKQWVQLVDKSIGADAGKEYRRLNPLIIQAQPRSRQADDWYDQVLAACLKNPLFELYKTRLSDIASMEKRIWGARPEITIDRRNPEFTEIVNRISAAATCESLKSYMDQLRTLPAVELDQTLNLVWTATRLGINADKSFASLAHFSQALRKSVAECLAISLGIDPSELVDVNQLNGEVIRAISVYLHTRCSFDAKQKEALSTMLRWITSGSFETYRNWGVANEPQGRKEQQALLQDMKLKGLLPSQLSMEQYLEWITSSTIERKLDEAQQPADLIRGVRRTFKQAVADGHIPADFLEIDPSSVEDKYARIYQPINDLSIQISKLSQNIKKLGESGQGTSELENTREIAKDELASYKAQHADEIKAAEAALSIATLLNLTSERIFGDRIKIGERNRPVRQIFDLLNQAYGSTHPMFRDDLTRLEKQFDGYKNRANLVNINLSFNDVINQNICFLIGKVPVPTCQHFAGKTTNNLGLLAYSMDPGVRIVIGFGPDGKPAARAVLRLVEDEQGLPQLFLERVYSTIQHHMVDDAIVEFALSKAERMGVDLFTHATETELDIEVAEHADLKSSGSRVPYVYSDAAGGLFAGGEFRIRDAFRVRRMVNV